MSNSEETVQRSLRVFEIQDVDIELPLDLARRHEHLFVGFEFTGELLGWHARLVGDDGDVVLAFPWYDHVDRSLGGGKRIWYAPWRKNFVDAFPTALTEDGWDDLDQGWWGQVTPVGDDVFIAETDFDELDEINDSSEIVVARPGFLFVGGVLVTWNRVTRLQYAQAWQGAVESCRRGNPSPVGQRSDLPVPNPKTGDVSHASTFAIGAR